MAYCWITNLPRYAAAIWLAFCLAALIGCGERDLIVRIAGERFIMELAVDEAARVTGLSYRDSFPEANGYDGGGMLFVFPEPQMLQFWMYECLIDIDVIFLDANGTVTAVHRMPAEPPRRQGETEQQYRNRLPYYASRLPAQFAIELPAGSIDRLNVQVDQRIDLPLERLKAMAE